ncbi:Zinc finger protein 1 [Bulinus truncatus]|nr:Zinc finger protein 1 [Bulinus truncatus]
MSYQLKTNARLETSEGNIVKPYSCGICGKGFLSATGFNLHMQAHEGRKFMCTICDSRFNQKVHLKTHLRGVHKLAQCTNCSEKGTMEAEKRIDLTKSTSGGEGLNWCAHCHLRFPSAPLYNKHFSQQHPGNIHEKLKRCHLNPKQSRQKQHYVQSCSSAQEGKPISYPYCPQRLPTVEQFEYHVAACHNTSPSMPYHCEICGRGLQTKGGLHLHMATHGDRKFTCSVCDSKFKFKHHLKNHLKCVHKLLSCPSCIRTFQNKDDFAQHVLKCRNIFNL